ncbi:hypothetical protein [Magnetospirillum sp. SS-4]|uniref:hypothetical protein n=1 Tax=Magnetospirillum sp. SS-4 TaxID=2681465 RepID=UPI001382C738|nr:hypothetical protein [Magnetospirillum sp. SS-4]CAA7616154.1 conserved exported hypothetical protein [Magnetospirillum sp. SS-4]
MLIRRLLAGAPVLALAACAALVNPSQSEVQIHTSPERARCELSGRGGFSTVVDTPAKAVIPHAAAPVTVACEAPGHRRTVSSLNATSSGWVWGNSALIAVTGGVAALGLLVDQALGADWTYGKDHRVDLDAERKRPLRARSRDGVHDLELEAR